MLGVRGHRGRSTQRDRAGARPPSPAASRHQEAHSAILLESAVLGPTPGWKESKQTVLCVHGKAPTARRNVPRGTYQGAWGEGRKEKGRRDTERGPRTHLGRPHHLVEKGKVGRGGAQRAPLGLLLRLCDLTGLCTLLFREVQPGKLKAGSGGRHTFLNDSGFPVCPFLVTVCRNTNKRGENVAVV